MQNKLFIDGQFVDGRAGATIPVLNPHDCSELLLERIAVDLCAGPAGLAERQIGQFVEQPPTNADQACGRELLGLANAKKWQLLDLVDA